MEEIGYWLTTSRARWLVVTVGGGSGAFGPEMLPGVGEAPGRPNVARIYDSYLGGKDNFAADREIAVRVAEAQPLVVAGVRANRAFLRRAIAFLAEQGIGQFLDLGSGLPTRDNVHQVAGRVNPEVRTVYVDNDPVVLVHARALLADSPRTIVVEGDLREPDKILADADVRAHLDFTRPVAVVMCAILHFIEQDPAGIVRAFTGAMVPGSALLVSHVVDDGDDAVSAATRKGAAIYAETTAPFVLRTREQVVAWFEGFTLVPPGLVDADAWRRAGSGKTTAPIVAGVGILDGRTDGE
jgi:O-methyltransferase involved in polyketide biosynthesis